MGTEVDRAYHNKPLAHIDVAIASESSTMWKTKNWNIHASSLSEYGRSICCIQYGMFIRHGAL